MGSLDSTPFLSASAEKPRASAVANCPPVAALGGSLSMWKRISLPTLRLSVFMRADWVVSPANGAGSTGEGQAGVLCRHEAPTVATEDAAECCHT